MKVLAIREQYGIYNSTDNLPVELPATIADSTIETHRQTTPTPVLKPSLKRKGKDIEQQGQDTANTRRVTRSKRRRVRIDEGGEVY
jgi:hypothetical protein